MDFKEGDRLKSDDYSLIGFLIKLGEKWFVAGEDGEAEFEPYVSDWELYPEDEKEF